MSLLDWGTYGRPDAEVLPLITPATARATDSVRAFRTGDARRSLTHLIAAANPRTDRGDAPSLGRY